MAGQRKSTPPGPGIDASGQTVVDPSFNVKALNEASVKRADDLRAQDRLNAKDVQRLTRHYEKQLRKAARQALQEQLTAIEKNRVEQKVDTKVAVDAALSAAKEAVGKNEIFVKEQLAQQSSTTGEQIKAQGDKLDELKTRFERSEQYGAGGQAQRVEARAGSANVGLWVGIAIAAVVGLSGAFIGTLGLAFTIYTLTR